MSIEIGLLMFPALMVAIFLGFPVAFALMGIAALFGYYRFEEALVHQLVAKVSDVASYYVLAAVPLFVFMGVMLERSGIAEKLFEAIHLWTRRLPGGLAVGTVLLCVVFAAASGVVGATEAVVGLLAIPIMLRYNYNKALNSGAQEVRVTVPYFTKTLYGILSLGDVWSGSSSAGARSYRIEIPESYALAALDGKISVVYESIQDDFYGGNNTDLTWILWLSDQPFPK